jgi:hypothetical protein
MSLLGKITVCSPLAKVLSLKTTDDLSIEYIGEHDNKVKGKVVPVLS